MATLTARRTVRWTLNTATTGVAITVKDIADVCLYAVTATAGYRVFSAGIKLHHVELWAPASSTGQPVTCAVDFESSSGIPGPSLRHSDTTMGITRPAHVYAKPPKNGYAALWMSPAMSSDVFTIVGPIGTVVELCYTGVQNDDTSATSVQNALVGASVGAFYQRGLDGVAVATSIFTSIDLPQI